jgi:hypothetical protein
MFLDGECLAVKRNANLEFWQETKVSVDLDEDKQWSGYVAEETKYGRHNGNPYLYNVDMGIVYRGLADWLDVGLSFKKEYEQDSSGKFRHENRPHLNFILKGKLCGLDTSSRLRFEYRDREHKKHEYRFRNKTTIKIPCKGLVDAGLQPFIAEEWFMNMGDSNINQNRFYTGFSWKLAEHIKGNIWYMWKASRGSGGWVNTNAIGTDLKFPF